ncbi:MAG: lysophospholipid acyltransferase family protein [Bacteroidales bacterium]|nr:lysophospholipid acyltransferase family protein [Bacteroidales bacterium]MBN2698187.1 lysophospholipid acyltransferase family protein [Bacteroidales bacterium]
MKLIETDEMIKAARLDRFGGASAARVLMMLLRINKINKLYEEISDQQGTGFIDELIRRLKLDFEVREEELKRIPREGPFITVSNHPFGGIDGLLLVKIVTMVRPDIKVLANFLLQRIKPVSDYILPVNPFEDRKDAASSIAGVKLSLQHLNQGNVLGIFPAGEVSSYNEDSYGISDREWQYPAIKMIKKARVPVVPIYFQGSNSRMFHLLGLIHPSLRTAKLPSEIFNKKHKKIRIRIGNPISVKDQDAIVDVSRYGRYLRAKTYALGSAIEVKKFFNPRLNRTSRIEPIIEPVEKQLILKEIETVREEHRLFSSSNYEVFCTPSVEIPHIMNELGRLREITFRAVGEGTNKSMDIDEYDLYYHQLFVWDSDEQKIVGAYRVGKGREIIEMYGVKGFYIQSLFRLSHRFVPILKQSLELGRSFIVEEYQRKPMPLFLLWKGILYFLLKHAEYRYLVGPVSISNQFSQFSKGLIISYIRKHYFNKELSKYVRPRTRYNVPGFNVDEDIILENTDEINKFDRFIKDIEPSDFTMPILLKRYLKINGKIIGFNMDPKFNNALDGLLILDLFDVPIETISSLSREIEDSSILERFEPGKMF